KTPPAGQCLRPLRGSAVAETGSVSGPASGSGWACGGVTRSASRGRSADRTRPAAARQPPPPSNVSRERRNGQDKLAEVFPRVEQRLRLRRLLEREGAVDDRPEDLGGEQPSQLFPIMPGSHGRAVDRDLLREDAADVLIRFWAGRGAAGDEPAAPCQRS